MTEKIRLKCKKCGTEFEVDEDMKTTPNCPNRECRYKVFISTSQIDKKSSVRPERFNKYQFNPLIFGDEMRLIPLGDIHLGAPDDECQIEKVEELVNWVRDKNDTFILGMGDYGDYAETKLGYSGGSADYESMNPTEQYLKLVQLFQPLADRGKIIGLLKGNHEERLEKYGRLEIMSLLCAQLKVPFFDPAVDLSIRVGKQTYTIYAFHGVGTSRTEAGALTMIERATKSMFHNIVLMGHTHQLAVKKTAKRINSHSFKVYKILTGHFLDWTGSYAQRFAYEPIPTGCALIKLYKDRYDYHVSV